jgi:non-heme chloroperoxidase
MCGTEGAASLTECRSLARPDGVGRREPGQPADETGREASCPLRGTLVSDQVWQASWNLAVTASAAAAVACIRTWTTDFRADLPRIDVPVLVLHGDADQVLPIDKTSRRLPGLIHDVKLTVIEGGPHAIPWTHAGQVNTALLGFLRG